MPSRRMTHKARREMLKKSRKREGCHLELYNKDGSPWLSAETPMTKEQATRIYELWLRIVKENKEASK